MKEIFETPLEVSADWEKRCYEIYDKNNDRVASNIEELDQATMFAAAPLMYEALKGAVKEACGTCAMMHVNPDTYDFIKNGCPFHDNERCDYRHCIEILRAAGGES